MKENKYLISRIIITALTCLCVVCGIKTHTHYSLDIPPTTILYLGNTWVVSSSNGIMNYTLNGMQINVLSPSYTVEQKKMIASLAEANRKYCASMGIPQLQGGTIDLNPYAPAFERNKTITTAPISTPTPTPSTPKKEEPKCEHVYKEEITKEATCKDTGTKTFTCEKCNNKYTEEIPVSEEHTFKEEVTKEPTCTEEGISANVCEVCGLSEETPIPKLEHEYGEEITAEPTCTENGVKTFTCKLCSDTYTEDIEATGHTEGQFEVTKPNGLFSFGEQVKECIVCGEVLETEVVPSKFQMFINKTFKK